MKTQILIAISESVLVAILKKQIRLPIILYTILQTLSVTVFERAPLIHLVNIIHTNKKILQFVTS